MAKQSTIGEIASSETGAEFAAALAKHSSLTADQIKKLFPTENDRAELLSLLEIVNDATSENEKKARIAQKIGQVGGAILKITKKFATGL
jgi:hypothetical protein